MHQQEQLNLNNNSTIKQSSQLLTQSKIIQSQSTNNQIIQQEQQSHHGHSHSHGQGSSCKKKHKKGGSKGGVNFGIIFYTLFTIVSCFYLTVYCFYPLQQNQQKRKINSVVFSITVFMCFWSYFQTIRTKNTFSKLKGLPNIIVDKITGNNFNQKQCKNCKYPKPPRVSHCSTCGSCIMKLDHHCMWTQNCIGFRNQRPFYLFTLYMTLGLMQYWYSVIFALGKMYGSCKFFSFFQPGIYILWVVTCFSAGVVGLMIVALFISHTMMVLTNHTTLMSMKNKSMCPIPFIQCRDPVLSDQLTNLYDRGQIQNIRSLFGNNILTAFLPFTRQEQNDFNFEIQHPLPTKGQLSQLSGGQAAQIQRDMQLKKTISKLKQVYKGQVFKFNGKIYQVK